MLYTTVYASMVPIQFEAFFVGECAIFYGGAGAGFPDPVEWSGLGRGIASIQGTADGEPIPIPGDPDIVAYSSENVEATGFVSFGWMEEEGGSHMLRAQLYSPEDGAIGIFIPEDDQFAVPIPAVNLPEKVLRFNGFLVSRGERKTINGFALFAHGIYGPPPFRDVVYLLLGDLGADGEPYTEDDTLYMTLWVREPTQIPSGPEIPAARVYRSEVEITD